MRRLAAAAVAAIGALVLPAAAVVGGASAGPESGAVYDSLGEGGSGLEVQHLYLAAPATRSEPGIVRFYVVTDCGAGDLDAEVDRNGEMRGRGRVYDVDDQGQDVVVDVRISGELGTEHGSGTLRATRITGPKCTDTRDWKVARTETVPGYRRLEAVIPSPNPNWSPRLAASSAGIFALVPAASDEDATTIARVNTDTNKLDSKTKVAMFADDFAVTDDALWLVDAIDGAVHRFDLATRKVVARIQVGEPADSNQDSDIPLGLATAHAGAVWVSIGDAGRVDRIDPATNAVTATFELGGPLASLRAGPAGLYAEIVLPAAGVATPDTADLERPLRTSIEGGTFNIERSRLVLVDGVTGILRAQVETTALWDLEVGPDGLYTSEGIDEIVRRDPATLAELVRGEFLAKAIGVAPPGLWLSGPDTVGVAADSLAERAVVPEIGTSAGSSLVTGFGSVWLSELGAITRFRDSGTPR